MIALGTPILANMYLLFLGECILLPLLLVSYISFDLESFLSGGGITISYLFLFIICRKLPLPFFHYALRTSLMCFKLPYRRQIEKVHKDRKFLFWHKRF